MSMPKLETRLRRVLPPSLIRAFEVPGVAANICLCVSLLLSSLAYGLSSHHKTQLLALGILVCSFLVRWPWVLLVVVLVIEQYSANSPLLIHLPWYSTAGSQIYQIRPWGIPGMTFLAGAAILGVLFRVWRSWRKVLFEIADPIVRIVFSALAVYICVSAISAFPQSGLSSFFAIARSIAPLVLVLGGYAAVISVNPKKLPQAVFYSVGTLVVLRAVTSILTWATARGQEVDGISGVTSFGPVVPYVSAILLVTILPSRAASGQSLISGALAFCCIVNLVGTMRITMFLVVLIGGLCAPAHEFRGKRLKAMAFTGVLLVAFALLPVEAGRNFAARLGSLVSVIGGGRPAKSSADLHFDDISVGLELALRHPLGIGIGAPQPAQFANSSAATVYVHNEFLQQWLTYGLFAFLAFLVFYAASALRGWLTMRSSSKGGAWNYFAGAFLVFSVIPLLTAPFLSTEQRFPVLFGAALAICWRSFFQTDKE